MQILVHGTIFEHKFHLISDDFPIPPHGIIGKDFLKRFKALINFGEMTIKFSKNEIEIVEIPIESELMNGVSALPPRSETFKLFHIKSEKFPCAIEPQEIEKGILIPSSISYEPNSSRRVLNTHNDIRIVNTKNIRSSPLTDFHILFTKKNESHTTNRLRSLHDTLRKKHLNS